MGGVPMDKYLSHAKQSLSTYGPPKSFITQIAKIASSTPAHPNHLVITGTILYPEKFLRRAETEFISKGYLQRKKEKNVKASWKKVTANKYKIMGNTLINRMS